MSSYEHLLEVERLQTRFETVDGIAQAVSDVSFHMDRGETLGLVGESGCGKSVTSLSIMGLIRWPPGKIVSGAIRFKGDDLLQLSPAEMRKVRGDRISMIFQEPMTSLNPVYTIGRQIAEMFRVHRQMGKKEAHDRAVEMLRRVQMPSPVKRAREYPHQLSGGMRQRAMIAMALACDPEILIADEPTTALDVTIQAQIIDLMLRLREDFGTATLMITHDLGVVAEMADRVVVMYAGRVVEAGQTRAVFKSPQHPYTRGLLRSVPRLGLRSETGRSRLKEVRGIVPNLYHLPEGCSFTPRCPEAMPVCKETLPRLTDQESGHQVRCHLYG
ncbi:ABC transporter ATP-binding protein [Desulfonema ishimotonii]|uniref:ABC transporter ATP-binding protein n=1 Tax=Desulfonema ishimotonii TaxID=45657 RepID=A0A401FXX7_9BACT|nr:ABC transporter ATP-binding protein [Desulfonema ishimotonii]GBC61828.1 ABC transporter ATP-binding protein [Desulfonema ishimotonii]